MVKILENCRKCIFKDCCVEFDPSSTMVYDNDESPTGYSVIETAFEKCTYIPTEKMKDFVLYALKEVGETNIPNDVYVRIPQDGTEWQPALTQHVTMFEI